MSDIFITLPSNQPKLRRPSSIRIRMHFRVALPIVRPIDLAKRWMSKHMDLLEHHCVDLQLKCPDTQQGSWESVNMSLTCQGFDVEFRIHQHGELVFLKYVKHSPHSIHAHYSFFSSEYAGLKELDQHLFELIPLSVDSNRE